MCILLNKKIKCDNIMSSKKITTEIIVHIAHKQVTTNANTTAIFNISWIQRVITANNNHSDDNNIKRMSWGLIIIVQPTCNTRTLFPIYFSLLLTQNSNHVSKYYLTLPKLICTPPSILINCDLYCEIE